MEELTKPFRPLTRDTLQDALLPKALDEQILHGVVNIATQRRRRPAALEIAGGHRLI
jgi:hypothetical protein